MQHIHRYGRVSGPRLVVSGVIDRPALGDDLVEAGQAGVTLSNRIGSDQPQRAAGPQVGEGAQEEERAIVGVAAGAGVEPVKRLAVVVAQRLTDAPAADERWVADEAVEARSRRCQGAAALENLRELQEPMEGVVLAGRSQGALGFVTRERFLGRVLDQQPARQVSRSASVSPSTNCVPTSRSHPRLTGRPRRRPRPTAAPWSGIAHVVHQEGPQLPAILARQGQRPLVLLE